MESVIRHAVADAMAYREGGMSAVIVENFGDTPFFKDRVPPETVAAMARAGTEIRRAVGDSFPVGFNVLRNDAAAALGLCAACGGEFIRVNVHTGAMVTDQGVIEGQAAETLRKRNQIGSGVKILADVLVKHASRLGIDVDLAQVASDTFYRGGADALIVTGAGTGEETAIDDLEQVREAVPDAPLLVGSGATAENVRSVLEFADGILVGSSLKTDGDLRKPVDPARVEAMVAVIS